MTICNKAPIDWMRIIGNITIPKTDELDTRDVLCADVAHGEHHMVMYSIEPHLPVKITSVDNLTRNLYLRRYTEKLESRLMYGEIVSESILIFDTINKLGNSPDDLSAVELLVPEVIHLIAQQGIGLPVFPLSVTGENAMVVKSPTRLPGLLRLKWKNGWCFSTEIIDEKTSVTKGTTVFFPIFRQDC
ncbi:MAG TPA: hypothetical protein PKA60_02600 [Candidatus Paceibacterota bacterium]|nr:hypothetical protein [Candidatus Paceibacterota bacterium]